VLTYEAASRAPVEEAWSLLARPGRWPEWAPHLRGAWGLGSPEVRRGAHGAARLFGVVPVPARVVAKRAGRAWVWRIGPVEIVHRVAPRPGGGPGSVVAVDMRAPGPLEALLALSYGPAVALLVRNLARVAERSAARGG
jgi:hypothetical protein